MDVYEGKRESAVTIGVSACLLGQMVRYDGGHKLDRYIADTLGRLFRFLPVCPEVECGMTIPREPMRLEGAPESPRLVTIDSRIDRTDQLLNFCHRRVSELETEGLCGFIFKKNSPSCGLHGVQLFTADGMPAGSGSGLFADTVASHFPLMPLAEEGELSDARIGEKFMKQAFAYARRIGIRINP